MNKGNSKAKLSKQKNDGRQTSIRSFFSTNFRKTIDSENNSRNTSAKRFTESKNVDEIRNDTKMSMKDVITSGQNGREILSPNVNCPGSVLLCGKNYSTDGACEKRKFETSGDLSDLLEELENSSPEDYVYLQSFASSKNHETSQKITSDAIKKRVKLSPSSTRNEKKPTIMNGISSGHEKLHSEIKINKLCESDQPRNENSMVQKASCVQNPCNAEVPDIENLADLLNDDCDEWLTSTCNFDLNEWTYCRVNSMQYSNAGLALTLRKFAKPSNTVFSSTTVCVLKGCWIDTPLKVDDIVCLKAYFDYKNTQWVVDNERGFITVHPDVLITGTGVVGSLFCQRRSVLSYIFPSFDPPNVAMIVGSLVHELLQEVLRRQIFIMDDIQLVIDNLIHAKHTLYSAYECDVAITTIRSQLEEFAPKIFSFVNTYINGKSSSNCGKTWLGDILDILSIEENFWIPQLGIKGKTDVILKARKNNKVKILPLELKTGRASNSSEHRGQIILYLIMMDEIGTDVDGGLLFYLRENKLIEINPKHAEKSGLMSMRNSLVSYIVTNETPALLSQNDFEPPTLPEPINHHSGCAKCPYLTVCSASITKKHRENMSKGNPLNDLSVKALAHLTESHIRFVFFWLGLLKLEEMERKKNRTFDISDLWHVNVEDREVRGYCMSNLRVLSVDVLGSRFLHKMKRIAGVNDYNLPNTYALVEGDYVVVSRGSRYAIASGYIETIEEQNISLKLDRMLEKDDDKYYVVDKYSMFDGLLGFNTSSLLMLFEDTVQGSNLRSFIIDATSPSFTSKIPSTVYDHCILDGLNVAQKNAVLKTLEADHYTLIKGMPGTGKTATIVAIIKLLVSMKYSVFVTSHTHSAVDNILLRLKGSNVDFLRLGSHIRVHDSLKDYCEHHVLEKQNFQSVRDLENFYNNKQVVAVTCMGCSHVVFRKRQFDYCIVDEATQVLLPTVIKSLYCSKKFILIGDPDQLPPVVQSKKASLLGLSESLFKRLDKPQVTSILNLQYRMNLQIMQLANSFAYENKLECANEEVGLATILSDSSRISSQSQYPEWMRLALSNHLNHSIILLDTCNLKTAPPLSEYSSQNEAEIAFSIVRELHRVCETTHDIGIIAPFSEQVKLLRSMSSVEYPVEINTVDQYQGRDRDIIIYSCTKASSTTDTGILSDKRRLTVAITRAKRKLIIIANVSTLRNYAVFEELFNFIPKECVIEVTRL